MAACLTLQAAPAGMAWQEYEELFEHARAVGIQIFASVWDLKSVDFMRKYTVHIPPPPP